MGTFRETLVNEVSTILDWSLDIEDEEKVPTKSDLTLGKKAISFQTAVLYMDVQGSSAYGLNHHRRTVAKILNAFVNGAVRIVYRRGGKIRSFNGDSILAFFDPTLENPCNHAVRSAMEISYFLTDIMRPAMKKSRFEEVLNVGVGVSYGEVLATKIGIRGMGNSDILWQGNATNLAAKLGDRAKKNTHSRVLVAKEVYDKLERKLTHTTVKKAEWLFGGWDETVHMWERVEGFKFGGKPKEAYQTGYHFKL